eukprot:scaffold66018_cov26-Tisochrysis_lutea.AAC.4
MHDHGPSHSQPDLGTLFSSPRLAPEHLARAVDALTMAQSSPSQACETRLMKAIQGRRKAMARMPTGTAE